MATAPPSPWPTVWLDGRLVDPQQARVSALDHGLVVGNGVFESLKVTEQGAFAVRRHLDRMARSAEALGLPAPDPGPVREGIEAVLSGRDYASGKVRITYTGGLGPLGSQAAFGPPTLVVAAAPTTLNSDPTAVVTVPWVRNERGALTGVKSTSYGENVRALAHATARGASEALFANTVGNLCEGTGSNVFCVFGDRIVTPPLSAGPLAGITRELLIEWCDVDEADLTVEEARGADEVFITSSLRDVQPVLRFDDVELEAPGPCTRKAAEAFAAESTRLVDP